MRIFYSKTTNHTIIIKDDQAWAFYGYPYNKPTDNLHEFLADVQSYIDLNPPSKLVYSNNTNKTPEKPIIEKPTDQIGQNFYNKTYKELKCEHSQKKNKQP